MHDTFNDGPDEHPVKRAQERARRGRQLPQSDSISLTPRQREVLDLVLEGNSRKQIAARLGLSEHTVIDHLKQIHKHFGVHTRAQLLARFIPKTPRTS